MQKKTFQFLWIFSILVAASLACNTIGQINQTRKTAQAVITQVQGIATQGGSLITTAQAFATRELPGVFDTAQAYTTQHPGLIDTAQAFVTQEGSSLVETARALMTEGPDLSSTGRAFATQVAEGENNPQIPEGIPILPRDQIKDLYATTGIVSYFTQMKFNQVVSFYKQGMEANGWSAVKEGTVETGDVAVLNYKMQNRAASVVISVNPMDKATAVIVTLQEK